MTYVLKTGRTPGTEAADAALRALVVDDFEANRRVTQLMLRQFGCQADVTGDAHEAIEMLARCAYDIVFMDCHMPEMDGFEATRLIRTRQPGPEQATPATVPVVGLTACTMTGDRERCLVAGMSDYLPKPIDKTSLRAVLERWAGSRLKPGSTAPEPAASIHGLSSVRARIAELTRNLPPEIVSQLVCEFIKNLEGRLESIREAVEDGDCSAVAHGAHLLRGSSLNLGAVRLSELCKQLERAADSRCLDGAGELLARLRTQCCSLIPELEAACKR